MIKSKEKIVLRATDTLLGLPVELEADLVVLAVGIVCSPRAIELAGKLNISHDTYGFYNESHPKLRPVESNTMGVYLAGACQGPKDIPLSVAQGSSVSSKVLGLLSKEQLKTSPLVGMVNQKRCVGCMRCQKVCPFNAIEELTLIDDIKVANVNPTLCQGCGVCNATCLPGAISLKGFTDDQLISEVEALCNLNPA
jgi:heterodisulfide reductase subunit A